MSFSWKGLLGVNSNNSGQSPSASTNPTSVHDKLQASSSSAASSPTTTVAGPSSTQLRTHQGGVPPISLFGAQSPNIYGNSGAVSPIPISGGSASFKGKQHARQDPWTNLLRPPLAEDSYGLAGMENFGNTCYVNSMLQALYFCKPFRESLMSYSDQGPPPSPISPTSLTSPNSSRTPTTEQSGSLRQAFSASSSFRDQQEGKKAGEGAGSDSANGTPEQDSLFIALRDLFQVISESAAKSTQRSPPVTIGSAAGSSVASRKGSSATRPMTAGSSGRGGAGNYTISTTPSNATAASASSVLASLGATQIPSSPVDAKAVKGFISVLKRENVLFDTTMHQDAHEMLNFVLNKVGEDLIEADKLRKKLQSEEDAKAREAGGVAEIDSAEKKAAEKVRLSDEAKVDGSNRICVRDVGPNGSTCIHRLFEGTLTNETRCLTCETVTSRDESFLDLSIDLEQNSSVTSCLRQFSASEMLCSRNKFFCDSCSGLQEAEKRMKIKKLPNVLALHLKRFKYEEAIQKYVKLAYRVVFPLELRLFNTSDDAEDPDRLYELFAIVVHIGVGPHHGHYVAIVKVGERWVVFDDENVGFIDESEISKYYGDRPGLGSAYVLFYQAVDIDFESLGLRDPAAANASAKGSYEDSALAALNSVERGRLSLVTQALENANGQRSSPTSSQRSLGPSPERPSHLPKHLSSSATSHGGNSPVTPVAEEGKAGGGWFGSFRSRDKRAGSQSLRRPKTASAGDVFLATPAALSPGLNGPPSSFNYGRPRATTSTTESTVADDASVSTAASSSLASGASLPRSMTSSSVLPGGVNGMGMTPLISGNETGDRPPPSPSSMAEGFGSLSASASASASRRPSAGEEQRLQDLAARNNWLSSSGITRNNRSRAASEGMPSSNTPALASGGAELAAFSPKKVNGALATPEKEAETLALSAEPSSNMTPTVTTTPLLADEPPTAGMINPSTATPTTTSVSSAATPSTGPHDTAGGEVSPSVRRLSSRLEGAAFAPAEKPLSKKDQKLIAKNSRRASSSAYVGSVTDQMRAGSGGGGLVSPSSAIHTRRSSVADARSLLSQAAQPQAGPGPSHHLGSASESSRGGGPTAVTATTTRAPLGMGTPSGKVNGTSGGHGTPSGVVKEATQSRSSNSAMPSRKSSISIAAGAAKGLGKTFGFGRSKN